MGKKPTSARGLFHATGRKSKPVAKRNSDGSYEKVEYLERAEDEFYPTPPDPIRSFLHAEFDRLIDFPLIWEGSAGDGAIVREMEALGLKVYASDLIDRGCDAEIKSFYDYKVAPARATVQNPPFAECNWGNGRANWIRHALEVLDLEYMALLMNWGWPAAAGMASFYAKHPPSRVYLMRWKIDFTGQGAPPALHAWWVWDKKWEGETALRMLDRRDARQTELF